MKSSAARLARLLECCKGEAKEAIEGCATLPPDEGYKEVRAVLRERFGDEFTVANSRMKRLIEKKDQSLMKYADR